MMKKGVYFTALLFCCTVAVQGQTIQYSRQTFKNPYSDAMQLVANISGYHHLLCFSAGKVPAIYVFDADLQLKEQKTFGIKLKENCDVRILPFTDHYLLYLHLPGSREHQLWKIDSEGEAVSLCATFQHLIDTILNKSTSTLQLVNQKEQLFIVAHTYYDGLKKMSSSVTELSPDLAPLHTAKVFYDFARGETLQQSLLTGNSLFLLKTAGNEETGHSLDVVRADLSSGEIVANSFNSGSHLYTAPALVYNSADSSLLVYALLREATNSSYSQRVVFLSRLNYLLQEQSPFSLLKTQFRNNTAANFLLLQGASPCWLNISNSARLRRVTPRAGRFDDFVESSATFNLRNYTSSSDYFTGTNPVSAVRLTVLNEKLRSVKDSLIANNQNIPDVQPQPYAKFTMRNKPYLILIQNFSAKHRGLLIVTTSTSEKLETSDVRVFDRYDYLLPQLQAVGNDYFILPYTYKKEIGLVKVRMQ